VLFCFGQDRSAERELKPGVVPELIGEAKQKCQQKSQPELAKITAFVTLRIDDRRVQFGWRGGHIPRSSNGAPAVRVRLLL
jgi:hypothetical protein